ncbi:MAG TPA: preprotein translocase subunit YajC [Chthoniobacterales bacterium]
MASSPCISLAPVLNGMPLRQPVAPDALSLPRPVISNMLITFLAQAKTAGPNPLTSFIPLIFFVVIAYYVFIRPQTRRQKEQQRLISELKTGDRIVTAAGIHGMITNIKETTVTVKVADNVKIEMEKSAVSNVLKPASAN